ncbi:MAG: hypothetical protein QM754_03460 [Tepidisphaeraceae bacterium]
MTKAADTVVDSRGMTLDSSVAAYGIGVNGNAFENSAIQTYNGWQYTAYWVKDGSSYYVALAPPADRHRHLAGHQPRALHVHQRPERR